VFQAPPRGPRRAPRSATHYTVPEMAIKAIYGSTAATGNQVNYEVATEPI